MKKDQIPSEYNPINCDHKLPNGFTAWQFQSEEQSNLNGGPNKVAVYVCLNCGEISIGGYRTGADGSHNSFDEHFSICSPDAIDAIIKQANFYNEEVKWGRVNEGPPAPHGVVWVNPNDRLPQTGSIVLVEYTSGYYERKEFTGLSAWWKKNIKQWLDELTSNHCDAVEFHDWVAANEWEINTRAQVTHTTEQLYELYQQSKK